MAIIYSGSAQWEIHEEREERFRIHVKSRIFSWRNPQVILNSMMKKCGGSTNSTLSCCEKPPSDYTAMRKASLTASTPRTMPQR